MNLMFGRLSGSPAPLETFVSFVICNASVTLNVTCFEIENYFGNCSYSETLDTLHNRPVPQPQHTPGHRLPHPSSTVIPFSRDKHSTTNIQQQTCRCRQSASCTTRIRVHACCDNRRIAVQNHKCTLWYGQTWQSFSSYLRKSFWDIVS